MWKKILYFLLTLLLITVVAGGIILYGRGYRFDPNKKSLSSTGILSISSYPQKSSIFLNDKLVSATDASLTLNPDWYEVRIVKDGYLPWQKKVRVQGEIVTQIDALLVPKNPSLRALSVSGIISPGLSPGSTRLAYFVDNQEIEAASGKIKGGLWMLELKTGPLGSQPQPKQLFVPGSNVNYANAKTFWSPDEEEIMVAFYSDNPKVTAPLSVFLVNIISPQNTPAINVTLNYEEILIDWVSEQQINENLRLSSLPKEITATLKETSSLINFSPDESKILYQATASANLLQVVTPPLIGSNPTDEIRQIEKNKFYVYDSKEDKNYYIADVNKEADTNIPPVWYTDSKHLILVQKDSIDIVDYDGSNKRSIYTGPFSNQIVFPWASGGKIVILTDLNSKSYPDLYEVDLR